MLVSVVFFVVADWAFWQVVAGILVHRLCGSYRKQDVDGSRGVVVVYEATKTHVICSLVYYVFFILW